jgi:hypothetical protein
MFVCVTKLDHDILFTFHPPMTAPPFLISTIVLQRVYTWKEGTVFLLGYFKSLLALFIILYRRGQIDVLLIELLPEQCVAIFEAKRQQYQTRMAHKMINQT